MSALSYYADQPRIERALTGFTELARLAYKPSLACFDIILCCTGHDEDAVKSSMGKPVDRMLQMACAMLDVVNDLTMLDGTKVKIRIGEQTGSNRQPLGHLARALLHQQPAGLNQQRNKYAASR